MPKTKVTPQVEHLPFWDALVAELGDPRPYTPTEFTPSFVVPDDAFVGTEIELDDALNVIDDAYEDTVAALDLIWAPPPPPELHIVLPTDQQTVVLHVESDVEQTRELPQWPS